MSEFEHGIALLTIREFFMDYDYTPLEDLLPAPIITPSQAGAVRLRDIVDGNGFIVVDAYPGIDVGQYVSMWITGSGISGSGAYVEDVNEPVKGAIHPNLANADKVYVHYVVKSAKQGGVVLFSSKRNEYKVDRSN
ncbi:hypothetical protein [Pseudomonas sp. TH31]|uniref:hypothetical protein n=1 Tax=Pseudomonas sp. TH31 TaxID=2796396 RepID=UPI0019140A7B|nr:hypothetical protein [Pseudomonas sp. TH31]MBK5417485.1 hypothetical protein [Pseudomonas sp. TH31]